YSLLQAKIIPVVAPLGVGEDGELYNLNADTVAAEIARAMHADKMVILTNVQGIMEDINRPESLISSIDAAKLQELIEKKTVSGGMIPKVNACIRAAQSGVAKTHIISAQIPHALLLEIYTEQGIGTEILSQKQ
ncbi:MAG: acetylglutamate kinase, partial [Candidatus Omnitrophota bacterium]